MNPDVELQVEPQVVGGLMASTSIELQVVTGDLFDAAAAGPSGLCRSMSSICHLGVVPQLTTLASWG